MKRKKPQRPIFSPLRRQYCRRCTVSLPGSGWVWVVPVRSCHGSFHSFYLTYSLFEFRFGFLLRSFASTLSFVLVRASTTPPYQTNTELCSRVSTLFSLLTSIIFLDLYLAVLCCFAFASLCFVCCLLLSLRPVLFYSFKSSRTQELNEQASTCCLHLLLPFGSFPALVPVFLQALDH
jgi:hypothetical protein